MARSLCQAWTTEGTSAPTPKEGGRNSSSRNPTCPGLPSSARTKPCRSTGEPALEVEGCDACFEGWSDGTAWKGWAQPLFDFQTAQTVLAALAPGWRYDEQADAFITPGDDGEESWPVAIVELPDGGAAKLYPIGAGSWIWGEADDGGEQS